MQVETLADVLEWTRSMHRNLADCLEYCASETDSERNRMLMNYLSTHERELDRVLKLSEADASPAALDTWVYEYFDKAPAKPEPVLNEIFHGKSTEEVFAVVIAQHEKIMDVYRYLQAQAAVESSHSLVDSLLALEKQEAQLLTTQVHRLDDL
ncbi:MAG: hypothetical protein P1U67_13565 [Alcanivoracaceae bacterium]|nr:hypothetical protein [Alcanivoracaceae bacterium]